MPDVPEDVRKTARTKEDMRRLINEYTAEWRQKNLEKAGVMSKIYFTPIHLKTFYKKNFNYKKGDLPITEDISEKVLTLPLYPTLTQQEMEYIINNIKKSLK